LIDRDFNTKDGNWFPIMHEMADKLMSYQLTTTEWQILIMFMRFCYGYQNSTCDITWKNMKGLTGLGDSSLSRAVNKLKKRNILNTSHTGSKTNVTYKINSKISTWKTLPMREVLPIREVNTTHTGSVPYKDNKDKRDKNKSVFVLPDWLDKEVWTEYKKYRQNGKGKFTPYAQSLAVKKLLKLKSEGNDPVKVIQQSILSGWSGLFPIKDNDGQSVSKSRELTDANIEDLYANP